MPLDPTRRRSRLNARPVMEPLEARRLLTRPLPIPLVPPDTRQVRFDHAVYTVKLDGPGTLHVRPAGRGTIGINLFGTTEATTLSVVRKRVGAHYEGTALAIGRINAKSGQLGAIDAAPARLLGTLSPLDNAARTIRLGAIGPQARIDVRGDLAQLETGSIELGPAGLVHVSGRIGRLDAGQINLQGGSLLVDQGVTDAIRAGTLRIGNGGRLGAGVSLGNLQVRDDALIESGGSLATSGTLGTLDVGRGLTIGAGGRIDVGQDLTGPVRIGNDLRILGGQLNVGGNLTSETSIGGNVAINNGGALTVGRDARGRFAVGGDLRLDNGRLAVGRDLNGALAINGSLIAGAGGILDLGRNAAGLVIDGNLDTSGGGLVNVGGNLDRLEVHGAIIGKGTPGAIDISIGLDLNNLVVLGIVPGAGSITGVDLDVAKNLVGIDVRHGFFNSFITVGVLIDGGTTAPAGGNIGPDGPVAVFNTEIRAGVQIRNLLINGDVKSDQVTNPAGRPTRIVAGQNRAGEFESGGNIDNFQITGSLIDAVLAASVAPEGGDGTLQQSCSDMPGDGTYDAPAGTLTVGTIGDESTIPHFTPESYDAFGRLIGYFYDTALDPVIDDCILPGAINSSFAPTPLSPNPPPENGTPIPLPTKSTVLGGVINTASHAGAYDFAGIFAADTRGVLVG
jgi:hypothetical protein